jgi:hypothetical protein
MNMKETPYYSECECGHIVQGVGQLDEVDGTLYGNECNNCGEEFIVQGWADEEGEE